MLTSSESEYIRGLISTYKLKGYKYYVCHTVTENNNNYDACIYFSKEEIKAVANNIFSVKNGIRLYIDSSPRSYNYNTGYSDTPRVAKYNDINGTFSVNIAEFIYTNAVVEYLETSYELNPDITLSGVTNFSIDKANLTLSCLLVIILLFSFIRGIFRIK